MEMTFSLLTQNKQSMTLKKVYFDNEKNTADQISAVFLISPERID